MFYCTVYQPLTGVTLLTFTVLAGVGGVRCWGVCGEVTGFGAWCVCLVGGGGGHVYQSNYSKNLSQQHL